MSDDPSLIDVQRVHRWLSEETRWARERPFDATVRAIENSLVIGLYAPAGEQAGLVRLVTDRATFAWICDVFVDASCRDQGFGSFLVRAAMDHPDVAGIRQVLKAVPGRSVYSRLGFSGLANSERWMELPAVTGYS